jgi:hypothetical protein
MPFSKRFTTILLGLTLSVATHAQQTNPVERQVANPITDTPNINPISPQQDISAPKIKRGMFEQEGGDGEVVVYSDRQTVEGEDGKRILTHSGNVDVRFGIYRLQADKVQLVVAPRVVSFSIRATTSASRVRRLSGTIKRSSGPSKTRPDSQIRRTTERSYISPPTASNASR